MIPDEKPESTRIHDRYMPYRDLTVLYEGRSEVIPLRVPDLSTHGMFINTPRYFPQGSVLNLRFRLPRTDQWVTARGEVRYCIHDLGIGVEFVEISLEAQQAIAEELRLIQEEA
jgi:hypothetical protein